MQAPKHSEEDARLRALYRYNILDTPDEQAFDDITRLAAYICDTPVAIVSLVDRERQWFKSETGVGLRETPLDISICAHAILQPGLFIVSDTLNDERFACNPIVTNDPHLRFYAGALLESPDGYPVGTLCVLDVKPRELTEEQKSALLALSRQVMAQMEMRIHAQEIEAVNVRLQRMMAESHHRIKNSLQLLAALVEIQNANHEDSVPVSELQRISWHIRGLATIHDLLTQEARSLDDGTTISARDAVGKLLAALHGMIGTRTVRHSVDDFTISARRASSLIVLVNELLSNALKHGRGDIDLTLNVEGENVRLEVCDDGDGFPADFDPTTAANTGLELIESLGKWDLKGDITYSNRPEGGALVSIVFPLPD